ncbi:Translation initiation factor 4F, ribosome/mRNA-bridging subunit (eIF-4G) [Trachipleistophora hominis]|uniref:Translation initiation factor 4F, ribosome/mRNA-bridging subunit (EIF-4G) n=1 Tax=Trachipleistophora hominis TaxID=72359 RepID=L7JR82_TRAHO|nr:Translation initiation factor 4F, ribosome/mRNA-bridging subunit (eIF-4G) [Trachipleistophora hominis]
MPFIIKRILFYPKKNLMEIGSPSIHRPYMHESGIPESEVVLFTENKARDLMAGGTKITKEMLDAIEFSSSSSEESTADNRDLGDGRAAVAENIDKIVADEFKAKLQKNEGESTEEASEESTKEPSHDNESLLSERLASTLRIAGETRVNEERLKIAIQKATKQIDNASKTVMVAEQEHLSVAVNSQTVTAAEQGQKEQRRAVEQPGAALPSQTVTATEQEQRRAVEQPGAALPSQTVTAAEQEQRRAIDQPREQPNTAMPAKTNEHEIRAQPAVAEPGITPAPVESLAEIADTTATLDIPQDDAAEKIYVYQPSAQQSLPAKVLLERIKTNFHVCFLDLHDEAVTLNENFRKEFYGKFMKILEDEIGQKDVGEKYIKSLQDIRKSLKSKYDNVVRKDVDVRYTVEEILAIKERAEVPINVDKTIFATVPRRERREDAISLFRLELNRIAWTNCNSTIERIKRLKVRRDDEIKKMAEILFEKAISEEAFCKLYAFVVQNLYKTFRSDEERRRSDTKSVFFTTLIKLCQNILHSKEKWSKAHDLSTLSMEERITMEETLENENIEKEVKKGRMLGTVKFISLLYSYTIIGFKGISACISSLLDLDDEQNVETLCALLSNCGEKMVQSGKHAELINVMNMLRQKRQWSNRIRFMVCDILEKCDGWIKEKRKDSPFKNSFAALKNDRGFVMDKENVEIAGKESRPAVEHGTVPAQQAPAGNSKQRESLLLDTIDVMSRIIEDVPHVNDYTALVNEMKERTKTVDLSIVLESYFLAIIEIYESYGDYLKLLRLYLTDVKADERIINESVVNVENKLGDISVDCPYAKSNFHLLAYSLGRWAGCPVKVGGYDEEGVKKKYESLEF